MAERTKTILVVVATVLAFQAMKLVLGYGPTLVVAMSVLSFCIGAMWGAGAQSLKAKAQGEGG